MKFGWPTVPIGSVAKPIERPEVPVPGKSYRQIGVRWWGEGVYERETIDGGDTQYGVMNRLVTNDIVINKIWARHGSVSVVQPELDGCYCSTEFPIFRPDFEQLDPRWFYWMTKTKWFWAFCDAKSRGTSGKNRIRPEQFLQIEIPLPSLDEQRRIMPHIERIMKQIWTVLDLRGQVTVATNNLSSAVERQIIGQLQEYDAVSLGSIAEIRSGVTLGRSLTGPLLEFPYLRVANVQDGFLDLTQVKTVFVKVEEKDKWQLQIGDVLLTEGGDWDKLGRGTVWKGEIPNCIFQNHIFCVRLDASRFDPRYLAALTRSPYGKAYFQGASKQTTNLATINKRQLAAFPVYNLPLDEQARVALHLDHMQAEIDQLRLIQTQAAVEVQALIPAILNRAFSGEL